MSNRSAINRDALAIGLATGAYGVSFGVLAVAAGLDVAKTCAMSLLVFTGASQFAVIGVLGGGRRGGRGAGARRCCWPRATWPTGCRWRRSCAARALARALQSQLVIDETTAMARAHEDPAAARHAFLATGISVFVLWNLGTLVGALAGEGLGDPRDLGLDAMFPAAFLALLAPQLRRPGAPQAAVAGCRGGGGAAAGGAGGRAGAGGGARGGAGRAGGAPGGRTPRELGRAAGPGGRVPTCSRPPARCWPAAAR